MEIEIVQRKENALLGRQEVKFRITHLAEATPTRDAVREKLAGLTGAKKGLIVVDEMHSTFGKGETEGYARVYATIDALSKSEPLFLLKRNKLEEHAPKKRKESAPAAGAKAAPKKR